MGKGKAILMVIFLWILSCNSGLSSSAGDESSESGEFSEEVEFVSKDSLAYTKDRDSLGHYKKQLASGYGFYRGEFHHSKTYDFNQIVYKVDPKEPLNKKFYQCKTYYKCGRGYDLLDSYWNSLEGEAFVELMNSYSSADSINLRLHAENQKVAAKLSFYDVFSLGTQNQNFRLYEHWVGELYYQKPHLWLALVTTPNDPPKSPEEISFEWVKYQPWKDPQVLDSLGRVNVSQWIDKYQIGALPYDFIKNFVLPMSHVSGDSAAPIVKYDENSNVVFPEPVLRGNLDLPGVVEWSFSQRWTELSGEFHFGTFTPKRTGVSPYQKSPLDFALNQSVLVIDELGWKGSSNFDSLGIFLESSKLKLKSEGELPPSVVRVHLQSSQALFDFRGVKMQEGFQLLLCGDGESEVRLYGELENLIVRGEVPVEVNGVLLSVQEREPCEGEFL